jgi:3-oxoacyl-[acyl-carrier protein] reductase
MRTDNGVAFDFAGQNVVVTGGTRGIGAGVTDAFLRAGARVVATHVSRDEDARALLHRYADTGRLTVEKFDVVSYDEAEAFFRAFERDVGVLHVLVNNAGIRRDAVVAMMSGEDWARVLDVNLTGVYVMSKLAVQLMMGERYGRIVNVTSPAGRLGSEGQSNYAAAKAGIVAFSKSLCREVASRHITVNCVSPGFIETELLSDLPAHLTESYRRMVPLNRFGTPGDVARCVLFLASRESSYITGSVLEVNGGI